MSKLLKLGAFWLLGPPLVYVAGVGVHRAVGVWGVVVFALLCVFLYDVARGGDV